MYMNARSIMLRGLWLLTAFTLLTGLLFAQATDSNLVGVVTDSTGAAVPDAAVIVTNKDTNIKYQALTNASGEYRLNNIPVGRYDVSATAKGFATATIINVALELNHVASVNLSLPIGAVTTTVEVTEAAATIDTSTAQLQTNFDSKQAIDVPLAGISRTLGTSGIYNLSLIGAGVATSGGIGQGTGPSVSGQRPENNSFTIDGVDNDDRFVTGPAMNVSNEAIAQMNVLQNQFSAEFGGASGGVFNAVVKSGTNALHGSIYEYFQNRDLNALDAQNVHAGQTSLPRFDSNRLGATVGGPIIKDKLFYFGNYEYNPVGQSAQPSQSVSAPTAAGLALLNGMSGLSQTNLGVFEKYVPVAAANNAGSTKVNGIDIPLGALSFASPNYNNAYNAIVAIDWNISNRDQLRGRYIYSNSTGIDFAANLPVFFQPAPAVANAGAISEFHNFSPTLENELRVSFRRFTTVTSAGNFQFPGLDVFPNLAFDDLNLQLGPDPLTPTGQIANNLQVQENLSKTWGRHSFKAGYSFADVILTGAFVQRARGDYDYSNLDEYLRDVSPTGGNLSGVSGERSVGAPNGVPFGFLEHTAFFNDDFRVRPNLTLNLGVRYEYVTEPVGSRAQAFSSIADVPGVITFPKPHYSPNDWSPRIGFAYSPGKSGVWSIRGGVSRAFDLTYINLNQNASPPYYQTTRDVDPRVSTANFLANGGLTAALPPGTPSVADARAAVASYTFSNQRPYALTGTIGVQRLLAKDYTVEARYVYTKGVHLWNQNRINIVSPVTSAQYIPTFLSMPSAATLGGLKTTLGDLEGISNNYLAQYGFPNNITAYKPWGDSRYNGLQLQVSKRYSKNFSYVVAYTWSHNFDDSTATNFSTILSPRRPQDFQDMRAEWASSALDRRQRFTFTPVYDFKPFQNGSWLMKNVVGNWSISGTYTYQSPEFATVQSGVDSNLNGDNAGDRAIINPAGNVHVGSGVTGYNALGQVSTGSDIVAYVAQNPNARYIVAGLGARSNSGRNTLPLDHINNFDVALVKRISVTERFRFDVGAQAFNLFNHAQFVGGFLNDVTPFATSTVSRSFLVPSSAQFGAYNQGTPEVGFFPSNARQLQLVAHFVF
jgi:carboxypeptidase family protein